MASRCVRFALALVSWVTACDDVGADNYNGLPGVCAPRPLLVCMDPFALNVDSGAAPAAAAWVTCKYGVYGCPEPAAENYRWALVSSPYFVPVASMCQYRGCNDTEAHNFDAKVCDALHTFAFAARFSHPSTLLWRVDAGYVQRRLLSICEAWVHGPFFSVVSSSLQ